MSESCQNAAADEFLTAERIAHLQNLTLEQSRAIFEELYELWWRTGRTAGGDWEALARWRLARLIETRRPFVRLAQYLTRGVE